MSEQTHLIIHGYFRMNHSNMTPIDIIQITTLFIDDHFMLTRGTYQWCIDKKILDQIKNVEIEKEFTSHIFKICKLN